MLSQATAEIEHNTECALYPWWQACPWNTKVTAYFTASFSRSQAEGNFSCKSFSCSHRKTSEDGLMPLLRWMMWKRDVTWLGWIFGTCAFHIWASLEIAISRRRDNLWLSRGPENFMVTLGSTCHPAGYSYLQNQRQPGERNTEHKKALKLQEMEQWLGTWQTYPQETQTQTEFRWSWAKMVHGSPTPMWA